MMVQTNGIYLDNSATTRVRPEVVGEMVRALTINFGNPSSPHRMGFEAERLVCAARRDVAVALAVEPGEIIFTSGGTEANNLAILGTARLRRRHGNHVIATRIEHPSVLKACAVLAEEGFEVTHLPVDRWGLIDPADLAAALRPETVLVTTMHVNNETGATQPLEEIGRVLARTGGRAGGRAVAPATGAVGSAERAVMLGHTAERAAALGHTAERAELGHTAERAAAAPGRAVWHVDAVQSFARLPLEPRRLGIDLMSVSAHKIHGPKGCGALYVRRGVELSPLLVGGGQEDGRRSGTENVPGIVGFAAAVRLAMAERETVPPRLREMRRRLVEGVLAAVPGASSAVPRASGAIPGSPSPGAVPGVSGAAPRASGAIPGSPSAVLRASGAIPGSPSPGAVPGVSGAAPRASGAIPGSPSAVPRASGAIPGSPSPGAVPGVSLNGPGLDDPAAAPHIVSISFPGLKGEVLVHALAEAGIFVSTGAACATRRTEPSHVLSAMGLSPREVDGTVRISLSHEVSAAEIERAVAEIARVVNEVRPFVRR